jgi:Flp pilus assembly protein TadG
MRRRNQKAASMLEFTFVAIPLIFVMISIFEISRGMWVFNSLSHGVKEATRYAIVHGNNCSIAPNNCTVTAAQVCQVLQNAAAGLEPARIKNVTMTTTTKSVGPLATLSSCAGNTTIFPSKDPGPNADVGGQQGAPVEISAVYEFDSALAFYWTGSRGFTFGRIYLPASAEERVQY